MVNKKQASLILRVNSKENPGYFVQIRDNVENAKFKFPGVLSLFGGEVEDYETGKEGFLREMSEEIEGIDFRNINLEHKIYDWKRDLTKVEGEINEEMKGNLNVFRGFNYSDLIPLEALGKDRGIRITYEDLFCALEEDHYFVGETNSMGKVNTKEEGKWIILPEEICRAAIFYPTDKMALMHDIALNNKRKSC